MPSSGSTQPGRRSTSDGEQLPAATDSGRPAGSLNDPAPAAQNDWTAEAVEAPDVSRRRWLILAVIACASFMNQLDTTVTIVAAPSVRAELGGGSATAQWLAAGYTLAFAVFLIPAGRLGDIYGRRLMFVIGGAGFTTASVACGLSSGPGVLIAARVIQGVFGALLIPQGLGIIKAAFSRRELGTAFGVFAPVIGMATVCGPIVAGALIGADIFGTGWRMVFLINLPIGVIVLAAAALVLPRTEERQRMQLDLIGAALVTGAAVLVIYPLVQGRTLGWPVWTWIMLGCGTLMFGMFAVYERGTHRTPIIEPSLLRNRTYLTGLAVAVVFFGAVAGQSLVLSMYMQAGLHFSALRAALTGIPFSLAIAGTSAVANRFITRFGRHVLHAGLAVMIFGLLVLATTVHHYGASITAAKLMGPTTIMGVGMGLVFGPLFRAILGEVSQQESGSASGVLSAVQQFGGSLGVAAIATIYFTLISPPSQVSSGMTTTALLIAAVVGLTFVLIFLLPNQRARDRR